MEQLIYPITKRFIKVMAACFGISAVIIGGYDLGFPALLDNINANLSALYCLIAKLFAFPVQIVSLAILCLWGTHVLLAGRGNYVIRSLSSIMLIPALLAVGVFFSGSLPAAMADFLFMLRKAFFILVATTAFFAYPFTAGYAPKDRKLFLFWAISLALYGLIEWIFYYLFSLTRPLPALAPVLGALYLILFHIIAISGPVLSLILAWRLYKNVLNIASMPEKMDPIFPQKEE